MTPLDKDGKTNASRSFDHSGSTAWSLTDAGDRLGPSGRRVPACSARPWRRPALGLAGRGRCSAQQAVDLACARCRRTPPVRTGRSAPSRRSPTAWSTMRTEVDLARLIVARRRPPDRRRRAGGAHTGPGEARGDGDPAARRRPRDADPRRRGAMRRRATCSGSGANARLYTFGEGSSEILRDLIARDLGVGAALSQPGGRPAMTGAADPAADERFRRRPAVPAGPARRDRGESSAAALRERSTCASSATPSTTAAGPRAGLARGDIGGPRGPVEAAGDGQARLRPATREAFRLETEGLEAEATGRLGRDPSTPPGATSGGRPTPFPFTPPGILRHPDRQPPGAGDPRRQGRRR